MIKRKYPAGETKNRIKIIFALIIFFNLPLINELISRDIFVTVKISFDKNSEAKYYEILWLTEDNELTAGGSFPEGSYVQKAVDTPFTAKINSNIRFFRIRSVYSRDVYGSWSQLYKIDISHIIKARQQEEIKTEKAGQLPVELQPLFKKITVGGEEKLFFIGRELPLAPLSEKKEFYYSVNKSQRRLYTLTLDPVSSGEYNIELFFQKDDQKPFRTLRFFIDKRAPLTFLGIYPPFYSSKNILYLGKNAYIELRASDPYSGIKNIYYRMYPVGEKPPSFMPALEKLFVRDITDAVEKDFSIEYYAEDMMDNKENIGIAYFFIDTMPPRIKKFSLKYGKITFLEIEDASTPVTLKVYSGSNVMFQKSIFETIELVKGRDIPESGKITFEIYDVLKNKTVIKKDIP